MRIRRRKGLSLIEVLAALSLVGLSVLGILALAQQELIAVAKAQRAEEEVRAASSILWRLSLFSADSLSAHLGWSRSGDLAYRVRPSTAGFFQAEVAMAATGAPLMTTGFFRPPSRESSTGRRP